MRKQGLSPTPAKGVGLVGFGQHMRCCLLPALRQLQIPVLCVTTRHPEVIRDSAARYGIPQVVESIEELSSRKDIIAAIVATEAASHPDIVEQLTASGMPVFVEKPLADSAASLRKRIERISASGAPAMVGFQKRFVPSYRQAKRLLDEKQLGEPVHLDYQLQTGPLGEGADFLLEVGIHALDLIQFFLGSVEVVAALKQESEGRRHFLLLARTAHGVSASVRMGELGDWNQPGERLEIAGPGHRVEIENLIHFTWQRPFQGHGGFPDVEGAGNLCWEPTFTVPSAENSSLYQQGYVGELEHFFASLEAGRPPSPGLQEALSGLELLDALREEMK